jgi:hypothetical protein
VAQGKHTESEIAREANTTLENVRKEKCVYFKEIGKKATISKESSDVERSPNGTMISKTERLSLELERDLLSVSPLTSEQLKVVYTYFYEGKLPGEVIRDTGYHPAAVEIEYYRYIRTDKRVPRHIALRIIDCISDEDLIKVTKEKFAPTGILTFEELESVMARLQFDPTFKRFNESLHTNLMATFAPLPAFCVRPLCKHCRGPVEGVIYLNQRLTKEQFESPSVYLLCNRCIMSARNNNHVL